MVGNKIYPDGYIYTYGLNSKHTLANFNKQDTRHLRNVFQNQLGKNHGC